MPLFLIKKAMIWRPVQDHWSQCVGRRLSEWGLSERVTMWKCTYLGSIVSIPYIITCIIPSPSTEQERWAPTEETQRSTGWKSRGLRRRRWLQRGEDFLLTFLHSPSFPFFFFLCNFILFSPVSSSCLLSVCKLTSMTVIQNHAMCLVFLNSRFSVFLLFCILAKCNTRRHLTGKCFTGIVGFMVVCKGFDWLSQLMCGGTTSAPVAQSYALFPPHSGSLFLSECHQWQRSSTAQCCTSSQVRNAFV